MVLINSAINKKTGNYTTHQKTERVSDINPQEYNNDFPTRCQPLSRRTNYFTRKCDFEHSDKYTKTTQAHKLRCSRIGPRAYNNALPSAPNKNNKVTKHGFQKPAISKKNDTNTEHR